MQTNPRISCKFTSKTNPNEYPRYIGGAMGANPSRSLHGGPRGPLLGDALEIVRETKRAWRLFVRQGDRKEKNGYPFTTFTDFSDFLGMILESLCQVILIRLTSE